MKKILIIAAIILVIYLLYKFVIKKDESESEDASQLTAAEIEAARLARLKHQSGLASAGADLSNVGMLKKLG